MILEKKINPIGIGADIVSKSVDERLSDIVKIKDPLTAVGFLIQDHVEWYGEPWAKDDASPSQGRRASKLQLQHARRDPRIT